MLYKKNNTRPKYVVAGVYDTVEKEGWQIFRMHTANNCVTHSATFNTQESTQHLWATLGNLEKSGEFANTLKKSRGFHVKLNLPGDILAHSEPTDWLLVSPLA